MLPLPDRAQPSAVGKRIRWPQLLDSSHPLIVAPIDDYLIFGPKQGLEVRRVAIQRLIAANVDVILTYPGAIERNPDLFCHKPFILNLTASTVETHHTLKRIIATCRRAVSLGAMGVAAHVNLCSRWAPQMLRDAGAIVEEAAALGLPCLGIVYPRAEDGHFDNNFDLLRQNDPQAYADLVAHCVSVGVDLGFDVIKTQFVGPPEVFRPVVRAADGVPIVIAGGPRVSDEKLLEMTRAAFTAGVAGISFGRNLFGRIEAAALVQQIRQQYHECQELN